MCIPHHVVIKKLLHSIGNIAYIRLDNKTPDFSCATILFIPQSGWGGSWKPLTLTPLDQRGA